LIYRLLFYALLIEAPLFLGSNRRIFWGINALLTAACLAAFVKSEWRNRNISRFDWHLVLVALGAIMLAILWMAVQATTWTPEFLHHPVWKMVEPDLHAPGAISIDPPLTWITLAWTASLAVIVVAARIGTSERNQRVALVLMVLVSLGVALFGIAVDVFGLETVGLLPKTAYQGWVTGTFVNRNTAASFFALGMIVALALATRSGGGAVARAMAPAVVVLFTALVMTGSRGGLACGALGAIAMLVFRLAERRRLGKPGFRLGLLLGLLCLVAAVATWWLVGERDDVGVSLAGRLALHTDTVRMIGARPWLGHGAGTFEAAYPLYRSAEVDSAYIWKHAHSTWLEAIATLGIPVAAVLIGMIAYVSASLFKAWWRSVADATVIIAALSGAVALGLHALIDFSLENQAVAIYFTSLLGLAIGQRMRRGSSPLP
jgi:O-antigen ligase